MYNVDDDGDDGLLEEDSSALGDDNEEDDGDEVIGRNKEELAKEETRWVNRSKLVVFLALALAAATVGALAYVLTSNEEEDDFKGEVRAYEYGISGVKGCQAYALPVFSSFFYSLRFSLGRL